MLLLLALFLQASTPTPAPGTLSVVYYYSPLRCAYTPATLPLPGPHKFTLTDGTATVTANGSVNPGTAGTLQASVLYKPTGSTCPTVTVIN